MGAVVGVVYFVTIFLFIPVPFVEWFTDKHFPQDFPHEKLSRFLASLLSLLCMLFLGFADDVIDIRWRVKIWFPLFASLPLLMVYYTTYGETRVVVPLLLREYLGTKLIDLGFLYYAYMSALCIFCTNAINILAGMNGIEGAQSLVIASSIALNDVIQIAATPHSETKEVHKNSLFLILPFIGCTLGYLKYNWFPARVFGGDTFAYFSGMIIAVTAIQSHFTKTVLLFMIPQIFNFIYSCPQLFGFIPCPRHRMPILNQSTGLVEPSYADIHKAKPLGRLIIKAFKLLGLVHIKKEEKQELMSNLTLINLVLVKGGPTREDVVVKRIIKLHILCSLVAFAIRYGLAGLLF